jgi:hypothetical protein
LGRLGQAGGVTAECPPQVKPVDGQGHDDAAAGGDGDHQTGVAEDEARPMPAKMLLMAAIMPPAV